MSTHHRSWGGPFAREGLPRRACPFAGALLLAAAGAVLALIAAAVMFVPWTRRPAIEQALPAAPLRGLRRGFGPLMGLDRAGT